MKLLAKPDNPRTPDSMVYGYEAYVVLGTDKDGCVHAACVSGTWTICDPDCFYWACPPDQGKKHCE